MKENRQHGSVVSWIQNSVDKAPTVVAGPRFPRQGDGRAPHEEVLRARLAATAQRAGVARRVQGEPGRKDMATL